jgi:hypothetical protein
VQSERFETVFFNLVPLAVAESLGIEPYIPFKINSRGLAKGSPMWNRKFHEFELKRQEFDDIYHQRSNVESVNSALKRKLGEGLLSRTEFARMSELLAKVLAYNVGVVIYQSQLHGLDPGPLDFLPRTIAPGSSPLGAAS